MATQAKSGKQESVEDVAAAIRSEEKIRAEAEKTWKAEGDPEYLTLPLLRKLYPLLRKPIPSAFIQKVPAMKGKPYESTGIRSVQVQIDRLNNVLGLGNWQDNYRYEQDGRLCQVIVSILGAPTEGGNRAMLAQASSYGGVEHGSTTGNIHKGSYTNAAKLAFARLGPGSEVYIGVADMDPDVSPELAGEAPKEAKPKSEIVGDEQVAQLRALWRQSGVDDKAWKTFLASRKKKDVREFNNDDFQAAVAFLAEHTDKGEDE